MKRCFLAFPAFLALLALLAGCEADDQPGAPNPTGTIVIDVHPDGIGIPWTLTAPDGTERNYTEDRTMTGQAIGAYGLQWGEVAEWEDISAYVDMQELTEGDTLYWHAVFVEMNPTGTLNVNLRVGDYELPGKAGDKSVLTLDIVDIFHTVHSMHVSTGLVEEGLPDDLVWEPILTDGTEGYDSSLQLSIDLPPGQYRSLKLLQSNALTWVCFDGTNTWHLPDYNAGADGPDQLWNVFSVDGLYVYDTSGNFTLQTPDERIGTVFEIVAGQETNVTIRSNFDTLTWFDEDSSGTWTVGDFLDDWTTIPGTTTMVDFIVENP